MLRTTCEVFLISKFKVLQRPLVCHWSKIPLILERAFLTFFVNFKCRGQNFLQRKKYFFFGPISQTNPFYTHKDWVYITGGIWKQLKKEKDNLTTLLLRCIMFYFFRFKFTYLPGKGRFITFILNLLIGNNGTS